MRALVVFIVVLVACAAAAAGDVEVNGVAISKAVSSMDASQDIIEFREAGDPAIRLLPGSKRFGVCIAAPSRLGVFDAELPVGDTPDRFIVKVEDGREFGRCLLASLKAEGPGEKRRYSYCLRCEDVTP